MRYRNPADRWGPVSQWLHWVLAALLIVVSAIGLLMVDMPRTPRTIGVYALHKSLGLTVLALAVLRLGWRLYAGAPAMIEGTPRWQAHAAGITHAALYLLLFLMPLSGWLLNSAAGYPLRWFDTVRVPALAARDDTLRALAGQLHEIGFWLLAVLVLVHAAAAFHHLLFRHDAVMQRMLPRRKEKPHV